MCTSRQRLLVLTAWPSRDVIRLSHEILTRNWWGTRDSFQLYTSELVMLEASAGDPTAAAERLKALQGMPILPMNLPVTYLAEELSEALKLPARARPDAFHIALAAAHGMAFLLTWNCRHLANATFADRIDEVCAQAGFLAPRIVTPEVLMELP